MVWHYALFAIDLRLLEIHCPELNLEVVMMMMMMMMMMHLLCKEPTIISEDGEVVEPPKKRPTLE